MNAQTNTETKTKGKKMFQNKQVLILKLTTNDEGEVVPTILDTPFTTKLRYAKDGLDKAIENGEVENGDELVVVQVSQHVKLKFKLTLGAVTSNEDKADEADEADEEDEDDDI